MVLRGVAPRTVFYAIGDVHGCLEKLLGLHIVIRTWHRDVHGTAPRRIIHLGNLIDRGPDSALVVASVRSLSPESLCLRGSHEAMMEAGVSRGLAVNPHTPRTATARREGLLAFRHWSTQGGAETLASYDGREEAFASDRRWLAGLPTRIDVPERGLVFAHAGIDPDTYPADDPETQMWTRALRFLDSARWTNPALDGVTVVHGHTPTQGSKPEISADGRRINVDTGACCGGPLSAAVLAQGEPVRFLSSDR